jgi:hypothetical protein
MRNLLVLALIGALSLGATVASAEEATLKSVTALHQEKSALKGQEIRVQGKVVKVNNGIMGRNFLHIQDGTGDQDSNDLTVTSKQTANVGDQVSITGRVVLNREFGSGYSYPLLLEDASVSAKK